MRRLLPGESLRSIPREVYNAVVDAVLDHLSLGDVGDRVRRTGEHAPPVITLRNSSGRFVDRWGVLALSSATTTPAQRADEWEGRVALDGIVPTSTTAAFAVLLEPLADGEIGRAVVSGAAWALLDVRCSTHTACGPDADRTSSLVTSASGPARVLWVESEADADADLDGLRRAYVLLGATTLGGCESEACGSQAWERCLEVVTAVRCTAGGWEYDTVTLYLSCDGRILFWDEEPCGGSGPGSPTLTLEDIEDGTCDECSALNQTYTFSQTGAQEWTATGTGTLCGNPITLTLYYDDPRWYLDIAGVQLYENLTAGSGWAGNESMGMSASSNTGECGGFPFNITIEA